MIRFDSSHLSSLRLAKPRLFCEDSHFSFPLVSLGGGLQAVSEDKREVFFCFVFFSET